MPKIYFPNEEKTNTHFQSSSLSPRPCPIPYSIIQGNLSKSWISILTSSFTFSNSALMVIGPSTIQATFWKLKLSVWNSLTIASWAISSLVRSREPYYLYKFLNFRRMSPFSIDKKPISMMRAGSFQYFNSSKTFFDKAIYKKLHQKYTSLSASRNCDPKYSNLTQQSLANISSSTALSLLLICFKLKLN